MSAITSALSSLLTWIGSVVSSLFTSAEGSTAAGALNPLLPFFAVGIAVSVVFLGVKAIRKLAWGA